MVETYDSAQTKMFYVPETTYGTTPTNPAMKGVLAESADPGIDPALIPIRTIGYRDLAALKKGLRTPAINVVYPLPSDAPIDFLQYWNPDIAGGIKGLSIQLLFFKGAFASATDIISLLYTGCRFNRLTCECHVEDIVKATVEIWAQNVAVGTTKIAGATYTEYAGAVPFDESYVKKGVLEYDRVTDWTFTVENNLRRVGVIRSSDGHLIKYLPYRHRNITGKVTFEFESKQEADELLNDDAIALKFGLGDSKEAIISQLKWENVTLPARIEDLVSFSAPFKARLIWIS